MSGDWMETSTGRQCYVLGPDPRFTAEDIAAGLARRCRFGGQLRRGVWHYSVAEHCVLLVRWARENIPHKVDERLLRTLLMHDAAEALIGDMVRPIKPFMQEFCALDRQLSRVIATRYNLSFPAGDWPTWVHELDSRILKDEREQVMCFAAGNKWKIDHLEPLGVSIQAWNARQAFDEFLHEMLQLGVRDFDKDQGVCV